MYSIRHKTNTTFSYLSTVFMTIRDKEKYANLPKFWQACYMLQTFRIFTMYVLCK